MYSMGLDQTCTEKLHDKHVIFDDFDGFFSLVKTAKSASNHTHLLTKDPVLYLLLLLFVNS